MLSQCDQETNDMLDDLRVYQDNYYLTKVNPFSHFLTVKL